MKELNRTLVFLAVGAASVVAATAAHYMNRPKPISGFEEVGQEFFPEFKDPTAPKAIKVVVFDEPTASIKDFEVAFEDGRWRIPSHSGYPADAKKRLAETSSSVIGIKRDALVSRRESDHEKYGVVDPQSTSSEKLKGRGQRITLSAEDGTALADYIIGKKVEGQEGFFYVRTPQDKSTYKARLKINLSTKFGDWIETDLLQIEPDKLVDVTINRHQIDRQKGELVDVEKVELDRKSFSDPWKLEGLDEEKEELKTDDVRTLVNNLDQLKIVGVRPKPPGLRPDLTLDPKIARDRKSALALQDRILSSLAGKGFYILPGEDNEPHLISNEGSVVAATNEGVEYTLLFGDIFTGSDREIEGVAAAGTDDRKDESKDEAKKDEGKKEDASKDEPKDGEKKEDDSKEGDKKSDLKKSRYLMVMVRFDESRLGEAPAEPVKPEAPPEKPAEEKKSDDKKPDDKKPEEKKDERTELEKKAAEQKPEEKKPEEKKPDEKKADEAKPDAKPGEEKKPDAQPAVDPKAEYDAAMVKYRREKEAYDNDVKLRKEKAEKGQKTVDQLNKRFGSWYYVISAESFDALRLSRAELVKEKEKPKTEEPKPGEAKPERDKPDAAKPE